MKLYKIVSLYSHILNIFLGRILNRFTKDMGQVDEILPSTMLDVLQVWHIMFKLL